MTNSDVDDDNHNRNYDRHVFLVDTTDQKYDMTSFISTLEQLSRNNQIIVPFFGFDQCVDFISQLISHTHVSYEAVCISLPIYINLYTIVCVCSYISTFN